MRQSVEQRTMGGIGLEGLSHGKKILVRAKN